MAKSRKRSSNVPADETKADKFSRLASARVTKAVKAIRALGNLASRSYEFTPAQVEAIYGYITGTWSEVAAKFNAIIEGGSPTAPSGEIKI